MANHENQDDFLSEQKDIEMPPEPDLGANETAKAKPKAALNKKPIAQAVGLISVAVLVVGGLLYLKLANRDNEKPVELGVVNNPVANPNTNSSADAGTLSFSIAPAEQPEPQTPPLPPPTSEEQKITPQIDEAAAARQAQERAMLEARYKSSVMVTGSGGGISPTAGEQGGSQTPSELQAVLGAMVAGQQQNTSGHEQLSAAATMGGRFNSGTTKAPISSASYNPNRSLLIQQGKVIDAVLETAVKSDIPSTIIARVSEPVYGEQGRLELLPAGTRLFGEYSSIVKAGQTEIAAVWRRAITPQGVEIMLDSPSTNNLGVVGMGGKVNNHFFRVFNTAALLSVLGAATATVNVNSSDNNNSAAQYRSEVANSFNDTAQNMLSKHADIQPTITVKHGTQIKILVAKDLDFSSLLN